MHITPHPAPLPPPPPASYTLEVSFDELVRIWLLSFNSEGGRLFPRNGDERLNAKIERQAPEVAAEGMRRKTINDYDWDREHREPF